MNLITFEESLRILQRSLQSLRRRVEKVPVRSALNRVLSEAVTAARDNPMEPLAAMDGIAVHLPAGAEYPLRLSTDQYHRVNTGELIPDGFTAVVKIEDVVWDGDVALLQEPAEFHQHIRHAGEDFSAGRLLLSAGHQLKPQDLSLILAAGCEEVEVYAKPVVAFVPTGSEFLGPAGHTVESNSAMVAGFVEQWGGTFYLSTPIPDDRAILKEKILALTASADVVVVSAGTSMGTADYTNEVLQAIGKVHFHGVALSPSKPVLYAEVNHKPVLGLPGYPVSAYVASYIYLRRILSALSAIAIPPQQSITISAEEYAPRDLDTFFRVHLFDVDGMLYAAKIRRGASSILSLSDMDGLLHIPAGTRVKKRDAVRVDVFRDRAVNSVVLKGDADPLVIRLLDLFRDEALGYRGLFWETPQQEALQSIIERNAHMVVLATCPVLEDPFPAFARQLQDVMLRYRMFGCSSGLVYRSGTGVADRIGRDKLRIAVPARRRELWNRFVAGRDLDPSSVHATFTVVPEDELTRSLDRGHWDAVFSDIRFLRQGQDVAGALQEYVDLVVSESYLAFPPIKKLIDLLLSDLFAGMVNSQNGCEIHSRGLLEEAPF